MGLVNMYNHNDSKCKAIPFRCLVFQDLAIANVSTSMESFDFKLKLTHSFLVILHLFRLIKYFIWFEPVINKIQ